MKPDAIDCILSLRRYILDPVWDFLFGIIPVFFGLNLFNCSPVIIPKPGCGRRTVIAEFA
jgi:hypothetical protein